MALGGVPLLSRAGPSPAARLNGVISYVMNWQMKTVQALAAVVLLVSAVIGTYILSTDSYLWSQAPTHADGLIVFVILDVALVVGLWWKPRLAVIGMTLLGLVQLGAMGADLFVGAMTFGESSSAAQSSFQQYLLRDTAFKTLLGVQILIVVVGIVAFMMSRRTQAMSSQKSPTVGVTSV